MYPSAKGFTLVELMTVVAVVAVLSAIAFPSFHSTLNSNRVATATNELMASMALARSEAIRNTRGGGVCTSVDGDSCGGNWSDGWLAWSDTNANRVLDAGEPVIRFARGNSKTTVTGSATTIAFDSRGRSDSGAQSIGLKPSSEATPARCVFLSATGQTRIEKAACP